MYPLNVLVARTFHKLILLLSIQNRLILRDTMKAKCTCGCNEDVTWKTNLQHLADSGTKAALVQQQHSFLWKHIFDTQKAQHPRILTPPKKSRHNLTMHSRYLSSAPVSNNPNEITPHHYNGNVDMVLDNHNDENLQGAQSDSENNAMNLARVAHVWSCDRVLQGNDSDSDSEPSKSDEDDDLSNPDLMLESESSDEDDGLATQCLEADVNKLPEWQMGLTAGDVLEEDFLSKAISQGNA